MDNFYPDGAEKFSKKDLNLIFIKSKLFML